MTSKRLYYLLIGAIAALCVALIGGTYATNSLLTSRAGQLTQLKAKSQALNQEQLSLNQAKKDIKNYSGLEKITRAVVPEDKNQAETVRQIVNIAAANGINLANITFPASTLGNLPNGTAVGAGSGVAAAPSGASLNNSKTTKLSQLTPVKNIPGVYDLLITVQSDTNQPVAYNKFINFLGALEHNRRTAQVSTISILPAPTNHNLLSFTLTLNEYIKP